MLKAVHFPHSDFLDAVVGLSPSRIWRVLMEEKEVLKQGIIGRIGTGESINIWLMNCLPRVGVVMGYGPNDHFTVQLGPLVFFSSKLYRIRA